jgi:hypothetical protein
MCRRITETPKWFRFWRGMKTSGKLASRSFQLYYSNAELKRTKIFLQKDQKMLKEVVDVLLIYSKFSTPTCFGI